MTFFLQSLEGYTFFSAYSAEEDDLYDFLPLYNEVISNPLKEGWFGDTPNPAQGRPLDPSSTGFDIR